MFLLVHKILDVLRWCVAIVKVVVVVVVLVVVVSVVGVGRWV